MIWKVNTDEDVNAFNMIESWLKAHCSNHDLEESDYTVERIGTSTRSIAITLIHDRSASSKLERVLSPLLWRGKKFHTVFTLKGVQADIINTRDSSPRVRRAGYLLYILGQILDSLASGLELKADPALASLTSKGVPLAQLIFNDYNDMPELRFNKIIRQFWTEI